MAIEPRTELLPSTGPPRLKRGELGTADIISAALANTAPAMSFFFSFGAIALAAGIASPIAIAVAGIVVLLKINSLMEFTKAMPSTGSYISYIGRTFGGIAGTLTALALSFGYIVAVGFVMAVLGGWTSTILQTFLSIHVPWQVITVVLVFLVGYLVIHGVRISTKWAVVTFAFELILILVSAIAMLVVHRGSLDLQAFNPLAVKNGLRGIGLAFPLAVFMFMGVGNPAPMVEETRNPRRSVPIAIFTSTVSVALIYLFMAWSTTVAYDGNLTQLTGASVPFVDAGVKVLGSAGILVYLAGFTSTFASLIGATNGQARMIFSAAREGLLPGFLARVGRQKTPWSAILFFLGVSLVITLIWGTQATPMTAAALMATLGTIPVALVYLVLNIALPVYYLRERRSMFSLWRHLVFPSLGTLAMLLPLWGLIQPGQPAPFNLFPYIILGYLVLASIYAVFLNRANPDLSDKVGSIIAED
ncbi:APC family permease [Alicyclobacillaceae bacterium I2511]|nr:APC family permease [Alicyclobacillaceae bacterium I2511]